MEPIRINRRTPRSQLSKEHKVAFGLLVFLGLGGVILGFISFGATIHRPIDLQFAEFAKEGRFLTQDEQEAREVEAMRTRDSDGDGLTDYDEVYIFKTSAYLADSDSDGFDDRTEIFSDNDPNCPKGRECAGGQGVALTTDSSGTLSGIVETREPELDPQTLSLLAQLQAQQGVGVDTELNSDNAAQLIEEILERYTPKQIRESLVQVGIEQGVLDSVSDEELKRIFRSALEEASAAGQLQEVLEQISPTGL